MIKLVSRTQQLETEAVLGPCSISLGTEEDVPVLRVWDPEDPDREVARFYVSTDAARKLAVQALSAANANSWGEMAEKLEAAAVEHDLEVVESRGRVVAVTEAE